MTPPEQDHWLVRPRTIRALWIGFSAILALTVLAQLFIDVKGYVEIDSWPAFGAWFGFGTCVLMVLTAKAFGVFLKRPENYFGEVDD